MSLRLAGVGVACLTTVKNLVSYVFLDHINAIASATASQSPLDPRETTEAQERYDEGSRQTQGFEVADKSPKETTRSPT